MTRAIAFALAVFASRGVEAAPFADPTRPPAAAAEAAGAEAAPAPRLQSVLIAPNRRIAVIEGQAVPLGGSYGEARLIRITESEVVLQSGEQKETLKLLPGVEKRIARVRKPAAAPAKGASR